jgi:hypothetical protein
MRLKSSLSLVDFLATFAGILIPALALLDDDNEWLLDDNSVGLLDDV